jgi:dimethylargininase
MFTTAITRKPGSNFADGITSSRFGRPDYQKALLQHVAYCETLNRCGLEVIVLEADEHYPDGCFVEDTAVVTSEIAVITRPEAETRKGEEEEIAKVLSRYRMLEKIKMPGTLDGGDVLRVEGHFYIGLSGRTNREGAGQLELILSRHGYTSSEVEVKDGLHLKSGIAYIGQGNFICVNAFSSIEALAGYIIVDETEGYASNCLSVNNYLLIPEGFPKTKKQLLKWGYSIIEIDMSEFRKMDGGLTCLSLLF